METIKTVMFPEPCSWVSCYELNFLFIKDIFLNWGIELFIQ